MTTQAPERIALKLAGTSVILRITSAELVPVGKYPEYAFVGVSVGVNEGRVVELRVPKASADRQLGRLELVVADTVGKALLFSRDPSEDPAKPYWGINLASGAKENGTVGATSVAAAGTGTLPNTPPPATDPTPPPEEKQSALYLRMTQWAITDILPLYVQAGIPVTMEGVAAIVATNFIQKNRH